MHVKKILGYVAERIEETHEGEEGPEALKPEKYLDLYCYEQVSSHSTLHVRGANSQKKIPVP